MDTPFSNMGIDPIQGTEIMEMLGLHSDDIQNPYNFNRLQDVMGYLSGIPEDTRGVLIRRVVTGKSTQDKLGHLWGYIELRKQEEVATKEVDRLRKEISFYEE